MRRKAPRPSYGSRSVRMPERATGGDAVADELFDLLDFRKAATLLARPDDLVIDAHLEDATGPIRGERHRPELLGKRGQQLLRPPACPQAPAEQCAIGDLRTLDPARMFTQSLTTRPELENSQRPTRTYDCNSPVAPQPPKDRHQQRHG